MNVVMLPLLETVSFGLHQEKWIGFILYADTLQYKNGAKLSRDEQENLKCLYQHFVLNREDFIDWGYLKRDFSMKREA